MEKEGYEKIKDRRKKIKSGQKEENGVEGKERRDLKKEAK